MEVAILLPIVILIALSVVDFGRLLFVQISLNSASREGARAASLGLAPAQVIDVTRAAAPLAVSMATLTSTSTMTVTSTACSETVENDSAQVTASTNFTWVTPVGLVRLFSASSSQGTAFNIVLKSTALCVL